MGLHIREQLHKTTLNNEKVDRFFLKSYTNRVRSYMYNSFTRLQVIHQSSESSLFNTHSVTFPILLMKQLRHSEVKKVCGRSHHFMMGEGRMQPGCMTSSPASRNAELCSKGQSSLVLLKSCRCAQSPHTHPLGSRRRCNIPFETPPFSTQTSPAYIKVHCQGIVFFFSK